LVVYVSPTSVPPQVPPTDGVKLVFGETVNTRVVPAVTFCTVEGVITPFAPALGVTGKVIEVKFATTVHGATIGLVV